MPAGGFGNLIALPLAKAPRERGNTVFLCADLKPVPDQWEFLRSVCRLSGEELDQILACVALLPPIVAAVESADPSFSLQSDEHVLDLSRPKIVSAMMAGEITARLDASLQPRHSA